MRKQLNMLLFGGWVEEKGDEKGYFRCYAYPRNMQDLF